MDNDTPRNDTPRQGRRVRSWEIVPPPTRPMVEIGYESFNHVIRLYGFESPEIEMMDDEPVTVSIRLVHKIKADVSRRVVGQRLSSGQVAWRVDCPPYYRHYADVYIAAAQEFLHHCGGTPGLASFTGVDPSDIRLGRNSTGTNEGRQEEPDRV